MFGLFKRKKIHEWALRLLKRVLSDVSEDNLLNQVNDNLLIGVITNASDIEGYVAFKYNYEVVNKYDNPKANSFRITNVKVFDKKSSSFLDYTIYVSRGMINGYSIQGSESFDIDLDQIDTSGFKKIDKKNAIDNQISQVLSSEEKRLINLSEVYKVHLKGHDYYYLEDIGDGDFIGFDIDKKVYKITHDPYEIELLDKSLMDIIGKGTD